jgi:hydroxymethylpyrimidine pyrophosphatase-like HAD family hydrolase
MIPSYKFVPTHPEKLFLLAADIDGTMLGDDEGEAQLKAFRKEYPGSFRLAYVTGRYCWSVMQLVDEGRLPPPDYICGSVGTELVDLGDPQNFLGREYVARVAHPWDLKTIYSLGEGDGIRRQDFEEGQPPYQAGFLWNGKPETLLAFRERLAAQNHHHILASYGQFIDVLPTALGKGKAVEFLQRKLSLDPDQVVVAGDAGNDREMFETVYPGILPANAWDELKATACQSRHYQSSLPTGRGVLDGLCHFGFIARTDLS